MMWYLTASIALALIAWAIYVNHRLARLEQEWKRKYKITDSPDVKASRHQ